MPKRSDTSQFSPRSMAPSVPIEDIDLFATSLFRSRGIAAKRMALSRAKGFLEVGDEDGHRVWSAVADRLTHVSGGDRHTD